MTRFITQLPMAKKVYVLVYWQKNNLAIGSVEVNTELYTNLDKALRDKKRHEVFYLTRIDTFEIEDQEQKPQKLEQDTQI